MINNVENKIIYLTLVHHLTKNPPTKKKNNNNIRDDFIKKK